MNRIKNLFKTKTRNVLSVYFTAGFPKLEDTAEIVKELEAQGIDMIELGVPFSDPMADGPVIQQSSTAALKNGMSLKKLFSQIKDIRKSVKIPLVLMGYLNPFAQYGIEKLFADCKETGVDAIIIPDLPFDEYMQNYKPLCEKYGVDLIMLITPETSQERIKLIDENCGGFIYMVSAAATTGARSGFGEEQIAYFDRINGMRLNHPRLIGFGISNKATMGDACKYAGGAIVGSFFIKCLSEEPTIKDAVSKLVAALR